MTTNDPRFLRIGPITIPDPTIMEAAARRTEGGELYRQIARSDMFRLGVVASASAAGDVSFRIELLLRIYSAEGEAKPSALVKAAILLKAIARRGYAPRHQDGGWISCEKQVARSGLVRECESLLRTIEENVEMRWSRGDSSAEGNP